MRGPVDTPVELTIRRGDRDPFAATILRAEIKVKHTAHRLLQPGVGYLRVTSFMHEELDKEVRAAIDELIAEGARGLILDLRNNPGGRLPQAHRISEMFVPQGTIVTTRTRIPGESSRLEADPSTPKYDLPLVVLQNGGSASASEILAGTLKEHGLATIVGERSFGKGSVQRILPLEPYRCALALTIATYHLPSGATPHKTGIEPDVHVALDEEQAASMARQGIYTWDEEAAAQDPQLQEAVRQLQLKLGR